MFCKWCGGNLTSYDTKCKRCGKEVPALSNCGGFYDLVPSANKEVEVQLAQTPTPPLVSIPKIKKNNIKRILIDLITLVVALGLSIALLFLVIALGKTSQSATETEINSDFVQEEKHVFYEATTQGDNTARKEENSEG